LNIEKAFGVVIRRLRKSLLLSQEELSEISSLDRGFISRLERGVQQPTLITIFQLATALKVPVSRMFIEAELLLNFNNSKICKYEPSNIDFNIFWNYYGVKLMKNSPSFLGNETILLVEDEKYVRDFLLEILKIKGYTVIVAEDGQEAVNKYKENMNLIDLVLMDVMMPNKDGVSAHKEIIEFNPNSKIILMSGYTTESLGGIKNINFIQKPMLPSIMFKQIRETLDLKNYIPVVPSEF